MTKLSPRQLAVLRFVGEFVRHESKAPTLRELCKHFGWSSTNAPVCHLRSLQRQGLLVMAEGSKSRDLKVTGSGWLALGYSRCDHCGSFVEPGKAVA